MARSAVLLFVVVALAALSSADAAFRTAPRTLRPKPGQQRALHRASRVTAAQDCQSSLKSCADCTSVLTCAKLSGIYRPISTAACPASTPYCSAGACVATLPADDACNTPANSATDFTCNGNGYFPSPSDCTKYYLCADGSAYAYDCSGFKNTVYSHEKDLCVPSSEATCATVSCTTNTIGTYQEWKANHSIYFVCTDTKPANAYVADCGADREIDATTGDCVLSCLREGRLPDDSAANKYYECVKTAANTFTGPTPATCPGTLVFDVATERCVSPASGSGSGSGGNSSDSGEVYYEDENMFAPSDSVSEDVYKLPVGLKVGSASAAYQIEGAWNASGKTDSIWDVFFHSRPHLDNGDVACDSYNRWQEDVAVLQQLGMQTYRFSMAWTRVLPLGDQASGYNPDGVQYYNNLINALINANIEPLVTIHHWDIPQSYQDDGGWLNPAIQDRYVDYADFLFNTYGDRVKRWILMNEPHIFCTLGYEGTAGAPAVGQTGTGAYECAHNMILAHAKAYHLYNDTYRAIQNGTVGSALDLEYSEPATNDPADIEAAERNHQFIFAWIADPFFTGDYPPLMRKVVDENSAAAGTKSRLPTFTDAEKALIKGTWDFVGLNHYSTQLVSPGAGTPASIASYSNDTNVASRSRKSWITTARSGSVVAPWGFRSLLNWIKNRYDNIPVLVSENGYAGFKDEGTTDPGRKGYYSTYMRAMLAAVNIDGCNVIGYTAWSMEDNLEWAIGGYDLKFGLTYVDFSDPNRTRTVKDSGALFKEVASTRKVNYYAPV